MKRLWLFDFDGVVADTLDTFEEVMRKTLGKFGYRFLKNRDDFLNLFNDNLYTSLSKKGIHGDDLKKIFADIESTTDFTSIRLFDGMKDALERIYKLTDITIISSNREFQIMAILKANNAEKYFSNILGYNAGPSKVEKIRTAAKMSGAEANGIYYVVDTAGDLKEAREAGVKSVAVGWGWHGQERLKAHKPDYFVETCEELAKLVADENNH